MASPFDAAMRAADAGITASFGDLASILPRKAVPKRGVVADPDRTSVTVKGVFMMTSDDQDMKGSRRGSELPGFTTVAVSEARLWLSAAEVTKLGFRPVKDDGVSMVDRPGVTYSIVRVDPTDVGDMILHLVPESQQ